LLASGSSDNIIKLWNKNTGELWKILSGHGGPVYTVTFDSNNILASGSVDITIKLWSK
jgi:WD40 repeat protein